MTLEQLIRLKIGVEDFLEDMERSKHINLANEARSFRSSVQCAINDKRKDV